MARPVVLVNGREVAPEGAAVSALDRGLALADGVFETIVARGEAVFRLEEHLGRLEAGAALLELATPSREELRATVATALRRSGAPAAVVRLTVTRGVDLGRGVAVREGLTPTVVVRVVPGAGATPASLTAVRLQTCSFPRNERSPLARVKSLAYTEAVAAWLEARRAGADDALWRTTRGTVACATSSNLFLVRGGWLVTPSLDEGVLPGIARRTVLALAAGMGVKTAETAVTPGDVAEAEEVFLTNVARGPTPVAAVDGRAVGGGRAGELTQRLAQAYWAAVEGR